MSVSFPANKRVHKQEKTVQKLKHLTTSLLRCSNNVHCCRYSSSDHCLDYRSIYCKQL